MWSSFGGLQIFWEKVFGSSIKNGDFSSKNISEELNKPIIRN